MTIYTEMPNLNAAFGSEGLHGSQKEGQGMSTERITEEKMLAAFTITPEQLDSAVNARGKQITYEVAIDMLDSIADNLTPPQVANGIDRIAWAVRCAFLMGFRDAIVIFNEATIMGVQEFFGGGG